MIDERGKQATKDDITAFVHELIKGDPNDKAYRKQMIDVLVNKVFVYDDKIVVFFNLTDGSEFVDLKYDQKFLDLVTEFVTEYEKKHARKEKTTTKCDSSNLISTGRA